ncbi:MAG: alpha/beta fold hydrolase, partial [Oxalobacteraceae bacterium]
LDLEDVVLAGYSYGGVIAAYYAAVYSSTRLTHLVLISANVPKYSSSENFPFGMEKDAIDQLNGFIRSDMPANLDLYGPVFALTEAQMPKATAEWLTAINLMNGEAAVRGDAVTYVRTNLEFHRTLYLRAQTPAMLCRYLRIAPGDVFETCFAATGTIYHVIDGTGVSIAMDEELRWSAGDSFLLPGGRPAQHRAGASGALLFLADDVPALAFYGAQPPADAALPIFYPAANVARQLGELYTRDPNEDLTGKALFLTNAAGGSYGTATPSMVAAFNTLETGGDQRAHRHNAAAISLAIAGEGVHSLVDGARIDWLPSLVMVTPPMALHSIHNRGAGMMRTLTVQDSGLFFYLRPT